MAANISPRLSKSQALVKAGLKAPGEFRSLALGFPITVVKTVEEIRHAKLLQLIAEHRTIQALANALGKSHAQISQLRNQVVHSATKKPRTIGDKMAREIEEKLGKPRGWMDTLDAPAAPEQQGQLWASPQPATAPADLVRWHQAARNLAQMAGNLEMTPDQFLQLVDAIVADSSAAEGDATSAYLQPLIRRAVKQEA